MNPLGGLFILLGILIIIMAVKGTYKNIGQSLRKI